MNILVNSGAPPSVAKLKLQPSPILDCRLQKHNVTATVKQPTKVLTKESPPRKVQKTLSENKVPCSVSSPKLNSTEEKNCKGMLTPDTHASKENTKNSLELSKNMTVSKKPKPQGNIKCAHCDKVYAFRSGLSRHLKRDHPHVDSSGYINCNQCNSRYIHCMFVI